MVSGVKQKKRFPMRSVNGGDLELLKYHVSAIEIHPPPAHSIVLATGWASSNICFIFNVLGLL